jgi:hypothetical protein
MHLFIRVQNGLILDSSPIAEESLQTLVLQAGAYYSKETALEMGWYPVEKVCPAEFSERYQKMRDIMVIDEENKKVVWTIYVEDKSQVELNEQDEIKRNEVRAIRNQKLVATDWRVARANEMSVPLAQEWVDYRQALRDITDQSDPWYIEWPVAPDDTQEPIPVLTEFAPQETNNETPVLIEGVNYFPNLEAPPAVSQ